MSEHARILIVDDDKDIRKTLAEILKDEGYIIETAENGKEAIKKAETNFYNLALIDIRLPDIVGTEVLRTFTKKHPSMMTILITGHADLQSAMDALNLGASAYIQKPIDYEALDRTIKECLKKQQTFVLRSEMPSSLRKPEIRTMLRAVEEGTITEFKPSFSYEKGIFYPQVENIIPDPATYYKVFEELEKYGIVKREFYNSVLVCPSCGSHRISDRFRCQFCGSANLDKGGAIEHVHCGNIDMHEKFVKGKKLICPKCGEELKALNEDHKKLGILFSCHDCGKTMMTPNHEYTCGDCGKSYAENQLNVKKNFAFTIEGEYKMLISKWVKDFDNILESAREFYRGITPLCEPNAPKVSYSAMAKKGETIRYKEQAGA